MDRKDEETAKVPFDLARSVLGENSKDHFSLCSDRYSFHWYKSRLQYSA